MTLSEIKQGFVVVSFNKWQHNYFNSKVEENAIYTDEAQAKLQANKLSAVSELYCVYSPVERRLIS